MTSANETLLSCKRRFFLTGCLFVALCGLSCVEGSCQSLPDGLYTFRGFEPPLKFSAPGAEGHAFLRQIPGLNNVYKGQLVILPAAAPSANIPATVHGILDPDSCELYGILNAPSGGFHLVFTYKVQDTMFRGLDVVRTLQFRPALSHGMHEFVYRGQPETNLPH